MKLICPYCEEPALDRVFNSRPRSDGTRMRQRTCGNCHRVTATVERVDAKSTPPMPKAKPHSRSAYTIEWFWHDDLRRTTVGQASFPLSCPANLLMRIEELTDEGYGVTVTPPGPRSVQQQNVRLLPANTADVIDV